MSDLEVERSEYCRSCIKSNKFDCDVRFYEQLMHELEAREIWPVYHQIAPIKAAVENIKALTVEHAKSLDDYGDEQHARELTDRIRDALLGLDTKPIKPTLALLDSLGNHGVTGLLIQKIINDRQDPAGYTEVINRMRRSIHNKEMRTEQVLLVGLFKLINGKGSVEKMVASYKFLIDKAMEELKQFKVNLEALPAEASAQTLKAVEFVTYVEGSKRILNVAFKLYQVLKILDGQSNYKFKLNNLKLEINNSITNLNSQYEIQFPLFEQLNHEYLKQATDRLLHDLLKGETQPLPLCFLCLDSHGVVQHNDRWVNPECWNFMRYATQKQ